MSWVYTLRMGHGGDPWWKAEDREPAYVGEFDPSHRRNLYAWLCRRADTIHSAWLLVDPESMGDMAADAVESDLMRTEGRSPLAWLLEQPFMVALEALLVGDGNSATIKKWHKEAK